jgi:hypothetical protein
MATGTIKYDADLYAEEYGGAKPYATMTYAIKGEKYLYKVAVDDDYKEPGEMEGMWMIRKDNNDYMVMEDEETVYKFPKGTFGGEIGGDPEDVAEGTYNSGSGKISISNEGPYSYVQLTQEDAVTKYYIKNGQLYAIESAITDEDGTTISVEIIKNLTNNVPDSTFDWPSTYTVTEGIPGAGGYDDNRSTEELASVGLTTAKYNAIKSAVGPTGFSMSMYDDGSLILMWNGKNNTAYSALKTALKTQLGGEWTSATDEVMSGMYMNTLEYSVGGNDYKATVMLYNGSLTLMFGAN